MNCQEYREIIAAHVDGALSAEEQKEVELHLNGCSRCAQIFAWEQQAAPVLKHRLSTAGLPAGLETQIKENLTEKPSWQWRCGAPWRYASAAAAFLIVPLAAYLLSTRWVANDTIFTDVLAQHAQLVNRASTGEASDSMAPPATLDLTPWGYRLIERRGAASGATTLVYIAPEKSFVVAQEIKTGRLEMAGAVKYKTASGKEFLLRQQGEVNVIAWQDRDIVCVLASHHSQQQLLELAQRIASRG